MLRVSLDAFKEYDAHYQGFIRQVIKWENAILPSCTKCGSYDTADVNVGIVSRTIHLAGATTKFKLIPNGPRPGRFYCNTCEAFFSAAGWDGPIWWDELIESEQDG